MIQRMKAFLRTGLWQGDLRSLPRGKARMLAALRVLFLAIDGFGRDLCGLRASALTFYSALSVVPFFALVFGIAKGFGLQNEIERMIASRVEWQSDVLQVITRYARTFIENASGGLIAGVGVLVLLWAVGSLMSNIEDSFNAIREIRRPRPLVRKFTDYFAMVLLGTILLALSSGITIAIAGGARRFGRGVPSLEFLSEAVLALLGLAPYILSWTLFTALYLFMPHGRVRIRPALAGGILAGTAFQVVQWIYIKFQIGVASYGAIYGSLAALPLFLVWLQTSWSLVLFGAEMVYAVENDETYGYFPGYAGVSFRVRLLVALRIAHYLASCFARGKPPPRSGDIARALAVPVRMVRSVLRELIETRLVSTLAAGEGEEQAYQPARDMDAVTFAGIIESLEDRGTGVTAGGELEELFLRLRQARRDSPANLRLTEVASDVGGRTSE